MSDRKREHLIAAINQEIKQAGDEWERRECEKSLLAYTHAGWRWAGEPGKFVDNWHIECMCEHLEAVAWRTNGSGRSRSNGINGRSIGVD
jgi:hypothetical protein